MSARDDVLLLQSGALFHFVQPYLFRVFFEPLVEGSSDAEFAVGTIRKLTGAAGRNRSTAPSRVTAG